MNNFGSKSRSAAETQDDDALWAVLADPKLLCYNHTVMYSFLFLTFMMLKWLILSDFSLPPVQQFILLSTLMLMLVFVGARMHSARIVYVGGERGICTCFGRMLESGVFVVKHTSDSVEYDRITHTKIIEVFRKRIIIFSQGPSLAPFSLSNFFMKQAPRFGSAKQYRGLKFAFNGEKVWMKCPSSEARRESEALAVSTFIDEASEKFTLRKSMSNGIFCDETTLWFVIARVLHADAYKNRAYRGRHYLAIGG
jgi:hypothetical protein